MSRSPRSSRIPGSGRRNVGIDVLRVVSVSAVVVGHAAPGMLGAEFLQIWRMPLFFLLAGFFFSDARTLGGEIRTRWRTLGVPYLVWFALVSAAVAAMAATPWPFDDGVVARALIGGAYTDMPYLAIWFISVLFFTAVLMRAVIGLPWWVGAAISLGGLLLVELPDSAAAYTPLGIGLVPACLGFMLAGFWFRRLQHRVPAPRLTGPLAVAVGMAAVALGVEPMNMKWSGFGTFLLTPAVAVLISCGMVLVFAHPVDDLLSRWRPAAVVVSELVRVATLVVFLHPVILHLARQALGIEAEALRVLLALLVCWALGVLVNRTRLSPYLSGLPARTPSTARG